MFRAAAIFAAACSFGAICLEYPYKLEGVVELLTFVSAVCSVTMFAATFFSVRSWTASQAGISAASLFVAPAAFLFLLFLFGRQINFHFASGASVMAFFSLSELGAIVLLVSRVLIAKRGEAR